MEIPWYLHTLDPIKDKDSYGIREGLCSKYQFELANRLGETAPIFNVFNFATIIRGVNKKKRFNKNFISHFIYVI